MTPSSTESASARTPASIKPKAGMLTTCDEEIKTLGVTRQFDFGQFIELFDLSKLTSTGLPARIVLQPKSTLAADQGSGATSTSSQPAATLAQAMPASNEVDLIEAFSPRTPSKVIHILKDEDRYVSGTITIQGDGRTYKLTTGEKELEALDDGQTVQVEAYWTDDQGQRHQTDIQLRREVKPATLEKEAFARIIAGELGDEADQYDLNPSQRAALIRGGP